MECGIEIMKYGIGDMECEIGDMTLGMRNWLSGSIRYVLFKINERNDANFWLPTYLILLT